MQYGPQAALIAERFGTNIRYSGAGLGYQLASVIAGGPAPLIAAAILAEHRVEHRDQLVHHRLLRRGHGRPDRDAGAPGDARGARRSSTSRTGPRARSSRRPGDRRRAPPPWSPAGRAGSGRPAPAASRRAAPHVDGRRLDGDGAEKVAETIGGEAWQVDLADTAALADLSLDVDILVNNAGIQHVARSRSSSRTRFAPILPLMLEAPFLLIRAVPAGDVRARARPGREHLVGARAAWRRRSSRRTSTRSTASRGCRRSPRSRAARTASPATASTPATCAPRWSRSRSPTRRRCTASRSPRWSRGHARRDRDQAAGRAGRGRRPGGLGRRHRRRPTSTGPRYTMDGGWTAR